MKYNYFLDALKNGRIFNHSIGDKITEIKSSTLEISEEDEGYTKFSDNTVSLYSKGGVICQLDLFIDTIEYLEDAPSTAALLNQNISNPCALFQFLTFNKIEYSIDFKMSNYAQLVISISSNGKIFLDLVGQEVTLLRYVHV